MTQNFASELVVETPTQRVYNLQRARLSRGRIIWLLANPHPLPLPRQYARPATHRKTEKERGAES